MTCYICDYIGPGAACVHTERSMQKLWKRSGGDIARCVRHGALICNEREFVDIGVARKWAQGKVDGYGRPIKN